MYRGRLERDLSVWVDKGFIDAAAASAMIREYDSRPASFSLGRVLAVMASALIGVAILLFVASNWDEIPRIVRLAGIVALIWAFYLGGAYAQVRGHTIAAAALLLLGTVSFGGAVSLVAQMYNISGDELTMFAVWFAVACISAFLFRNGSQIFLAGLIAWAFCALYLYQEGGRWIVWSSWIVWAPPVMAAVMIALARYTGASAARHLAYLMALGWLTWLYSFYESLPTAVLFALCGMVAFLAVALPVSPLYRFARAAGAAPAFYTFLVAAIGFLLMHGEIDNGFFQTYRGTSNPLPLVLLAFVTLASAVVAIALSGRDNGAVRYLAYLVFALEILYLASETVGSIIGTSGFFLVCGVLVALAAWLVVRLERRFSRGREVRL